MSLCSQSLLPPRCPAPLVLFLAPSLTTFPEMSMPTNWHLRVSTLALNLYLQPCLSQQSLFPVCPAVGGLKPPAPAPLLLTLPLNHAVSRSSGARSSHALSRPDSHGRSNGVATHLSDEHCSLSCRCLRINTCPSCQHPLWLWCHLDGESQKPHIAHKAPRPDLAS